MSSTCSVQPGPDRYEGGGGCLLGRSGPLSDTPGLRESPWPDCGQTVNISPVLVLCVCVYTVCVCVCVYTLHVCGCMGILREKIKECLFCWLFIE